MKRNIITNLSQGLFAVALSGLLLGSCTSGFEKFNTNPDSAQNIDQKTLITTMEMDAVIPCSDEGANAYQRACNLMGDSYSGYMAAISSFDNGGVNTTTYALDATDYNNVPFSVAFTNVMSAWLTLSYAYEAEQITEDTFAVAEVLKVFALQRATDIYGPLPVTHFGETENPYDAQETVYMKLFEDLNAAIAVLEDYATNSPDATPLQEVDIVYQGSYPKWLRLANSLKLRMAMRVVYAIPDQARAWAEEAVASGVIESADGSATLATVGSIQVFNPLEEVWNAYADTRMGATMDAYLNGYKDPRLATYFKPCEDGLYHGVRNGIAAISKEYYLGMSVPNVDKTTPVRWLMSSEVAFLRAEGAMRGWAMGGDAESFYRRGIELSFLENGLSAAEAATYAESELTPAAFEDASGSTTHYNIAAPSQITVKWDSSADSEQMLERIITQKWIAMFPNGQEAWSEFRRTGYPRIFPIVNDRSNGTVDVNEQIRRMTFPRSEYSNNRAALNRAIRLLGGPDQGSTKLWWDKKNN